jgi:hypothetical protein
VLFLANSAANNTVRHHVSGMPEYLIQAFGDEIGELEATADIIATAAHAARGLELPNSGKLPVVTY